MDREQLGKMKLEALRVLALERGVGDAKSLGRAELIDRLSPKTLVERAKEAVAHAVERVRHHRAEVDSRPTVDSSEAEKQPEKATEAAAEKPETPAEKLGVPSQTVHPHVAAGNGAGAPAGNGEPVGMLDYEELPETYGVDECELLYKDPFWVFAYWEVTDAGVAAARAQLGQSAASARLVLRMFTTLPGADGVDRQIHDVDLSWNHGRRYLSAPKPGAHLRVAVGLLSSEGYFAPIAHSSLVRVPPAEPQPGPVEWMEVVPPRSRGRQREPIVIVRRGADRNERGVRAPEGFDAGEAPGGSSPTARRPGAPGFPFGMGSSPGKRGGGA